VERGALVIRQDNPAADSCYFIRSGTVAVLKSARRVSVTRTVHLSQHWNSDDDNDDENGGENEDDDEEEEEDEEDGAASVSSPVAQVARQGLHSSTYFLKLCRVCH